jgi:predicted Zn-dependent protease
VPVAFDQPGLWWVTTDDYYDDVQAVMAGRGQLSRVADAVLRLRALQPDEAHWQYMEAWLLVEARQWAAARDRFAALRDVSPPLAADGIASVDALSGERPEEMAEEAATALRLAPDDPNVVATNALVAARQGRFADAEAFCARAEAGVGDSPVLLAVVSAIRAYSASLRGDEAAARAHADAARALDADCLVLDLVG